MTPPRTVWYERVTILAGALVFVVRVLVPLWKLRHP